MIDHELPGTVKTWFCDWCFLLKTERVHFEAVSITLVNRTFKECLISPSAAILKNEMYRRTNNETIPVLIKMSAFIRENILIVVWYRIAGERRIQRVLQFN